MHRFNWLALFGCLLFAPVLAQQTPTFTKTFAPNIVTPNNTTVLTFTVDNSASANAATSIDFTDNLPATMVVGSPSNVSTTCTGGTLSAMANL